MTQTLAFHPRPEADGQELQLPLSRSLGHGYMHMADLGSGLRLSVSDYTLHSETRMSYDAFPAVLGFGFCLSGRIRSRSQGFERPDTIQAGKSALFHLNAGSTEESVGTERVIRINILVEPDQCPGVFGTPGGGLPPVLEEILSSPGKAFTSLTPAMHATILQILGCRLEGPARHLFLKGKALELMALKLSATDRKNNRGAKRLKDDDFDRTRLAAELLSRDLENPPGLSELSRKAGMCQSKLHRCFKQVYGMTPFDFLRRKRLEKAEALLRQGRLNVTQAACTVGYSSLSHFSKAFKQAYGYLPGQCGKAGAKD